MASDFAMVFKLVLVVKSHRMAFTADVMQVPFASATIANAPVTEDRGAGRSWRTKVQAAAEEEHLQASRRGKALAEASLLAKAGPRSGRNSLE